MVEREWGIGVGVDCGELERRAVLCCLEDVIGCRGCGNRDLPCHV